MPTILSASLRVEMLLKCQPAKIQYLAESGELVERTLRLPPDETSSTVRALNRSCGWDLDVDS